jgi:hypothetical protein
MLYMWRLWLTRRWRGVSAAVSALLIVLVALLMTLNDSETGVRFLGDFNAPRPAAASDPSGAVLPRSNTPILSILDTDLPASAGPQTVADAQAAWSADEIALRQQEVLAAITCARQQHGQGALTLDPVLSQTAGDAWLQLVHAPSWSLMQLPGTYALRGVLSLDFAAPELAAASATPLSADQRSVTTCTVGGFDATGLSPSTDAHSIGIAVFPPQAAWDSASAVVLVK